MSEYHKIPKDIAVYMNSDPDGDYYCNSCVMFIPKINECTAVCGYISPTGGCNIYIHGKSNAKIDQINPHRTDYSESGYVSSGPFSCKRCRHSYKSGNKYECIRVEGEIKPNACCNFWERKREGRETMIIKGLKGV